VSRFYVRLIMELRFLEKSEWFLDKELLGELVDVVLGSDVGRIFTHAGKEYAEKLAPDVAAVRKALVSGKNGVFDAIDVARRNDANSHAVFTYKPLAFKCSVRVGGDALATRKATVVDTLDAIARALIGLLRHRGGVDTGMIYVADDDSPLVYPRLRPPVMVGWGTMTQIAQYIDVRFHDDPRLRGSPDIVNKVARAAVPVGVERIERDELVILRWLDSVANPIDVATALSQYERWLSRLLPTQPAYGYNDLGDLEDAPEERVAKAPWTFYDERRKVAYKAIMVDSDGGVDDDLWTSLVQAIKGGAKTNTKVRLIVPLRDLALGLRVRARAAGFDAVLYVDEERRFWNPDPPGEWVEDIKETPKG
jgi:hypothetical protein